MPGDPLIPGTLVQVPGGGTGGEGVGHPGPVVDVLRSILRELKSLGSPGSVGLLQQVATYSLTEDALQTLSFTFEVPIDGDVELEILSLSGLWITPDSASLDLTVENVTAFILKAVPGSSVGLPLLLKIEQPVSTALVTAVQFQVGSEGTSISARDIADSKGKATVIITCAVVNNSSNPHSITVSAALAYLVRNASS